VVTMVSTATVPFVGHAPHPLECARAPEARVRTAAEYFMLTVTRVVMQV